MKLLQFFVPGKGKRVGILEGEDVVDITTNEAPSVLALLEQAADAGQLLDKRAQKVLDSLKSPPRYRYAELNNPPDASQPHLLLPIDAPEVYGCGVTYKRSAEERDLDSASDIYTRVYFSARPEIFFKATQSRCAAHLDFICIRSDSNFTATEPELAFVLGKDRQIVGYTACNDVSAWDIERENPLYLPQSKTYKGCCAFGPVIATPSTIPDPYNLNLTCRIRRGGKVVFEETVHTSKINRRFDELAEYLCRDNVVPVGTLVSTGTGIMVPQEFALKDGDITEIEIEGIGTLVNLVKKLGV